MLNTLTAGSDLEPIRIDSISRKTLALFAGASGDHQPTHLDIDAARAKGREDVIAHGMLMMAYLSRLITQAVSQDRVRSFNARFLAITPVKASATCTGHVASVESGLARLELKITLDQGATVVVGEAVVDVS